MNSVGPVYLVGLEGRPRLLTQSHVQAAAPHPIPAAVTICRSECQPATSTAIPLLGALWQRGSLVLHAQEQQ